MACGQLLLLLTTLVCGSLSADLNTQPFPDGFVFGVATASYQIEGAWDTNGKGENIWDRLTHEHPEKILDGSNGDIACDSYNKASEDIGLISNLGVQFYRFSISWSRILPTGLKYEINDDGIRYYNDIINQLIANGITPFITIYHWDLPQALQDLGGWTNPAMIDYYEDFARIAFENFGDRVKMWITFNEPRQTCLSGYTNGHAPSLNSDGVGIYLCAHNVIKSHARVYHLYNDVFKPTQNGRISITLDSGWVEPSSTNAADIEACERDMQFNTGWFANAIYSQSGNYPQVMIDQIGQRSIEEGFDSSRLPEFTPEEIEYIKGTYDFYGINHYSSVMGADRAPDPIGDPAFWKDVRTATWHDPNWPGSASGWLKVVPWGFTKILTWIKTTYGDVDIYVTENGFSDNGELDDAGRTEYYLLYLSAMLDAIYTNNVNVKGYTAWSLMDNFEWLDGYVNRFGMHHVDFNDPNRPRTMKTSAGMYKQIIANWRLPNSTYTNIHTIH